MYNYYMNKLSPADRKIVENYDDSAWSIYNKKHGKKEEGVGCSMEEELNGTPDVVSCNQDNPENAGQACHMENYMYQMEEDNNRWFDRFKDLINNFVEPQEALDLVSMEMDQEGLEAEEMDAIMDQLYSHCSVSNTHQSEYNESDNDLDFTNDKTNGNLDFTKPAGDLDFTNDKTNGDLDFTDDEEVEEAFDLNNGYDDINDAQGQDYFPSGADSPVVRGIGGNARSGDNPEQKRVAVAEVHKELVYSYRKYLGENNKR